MSAKVFKQQTAVRFAAFALPKLGETENNINSQPPLDPVSSFDFEEAVDFEPFVEVERTPQTVDDVLQNAQEQAARIVAQAEEQYDLIERAAQEKAMLEAQKMVEAAVIEQIGELRENFTVTLREISGLRDEISARVETDVVELALGIAKKIVGREVMFDREIALTLVKVSLKKINSRAPLAQIHLHPEDYGYVEARREQIDFRGSLEFIEDASISAGGCLIHTETGEVDARIESQFEEIAYGLLGK